MSIFKKRSESKGNKKYPYDEIDIQSIPNFNKGQGLEEDFTNSVNSVYGLAARWNTIVRDGNANEKLQRELCTSLDSDLESIYDDLMKLQETHKAIHGVVSVVKFNVNNVKNRSE